MFAQILCQLVEIIYTNCWELMKSMGKSWQCIDLQVKYGKVCTLWYDAAGNISPSRRSGWPKCTMMERAIHDLEKGVVELGFVYCLIA
jgi:hypothetical protein